MPKEALQDSALFVEETEVFTRDNVINSFYVFNVSKTLREPIDQIHAFFAAKTIQDRNVERYGLPGEFNPFVAGTFEILNATSVGEMYRLRDLNTVKDERKKRLFQKLMDRYRIQGRIYTTRDLWEDKAYWAILEELLEGYTFAEEQLIKDTLEIFRGNDRLAKVIKVAQIPPQVIDLGPKLLERVAHWPAAMLYTPAEVAEAAFFARKKGLNVKIGPVKERLYDKYITPFMDVIHLRQPVGLASRRVKPRTVTPYTANSRGGGPETRIFFDDTAKSIRERISGFEPEEYTFACEPKTGAVLNPFLQLLVYAVEAARCLGSEPIVLAGRQLHTGGEALCLYRMGLYSIGQVADEIASLIETFITAPLRD